MNRIIYWLLGFEWFTEAVIRLGGSYQRTKGLIEGPPVNGWRTLLPDSRGDRGRIWWGRR